MMHPRFVGVRKELRRWLMESGPTGIVMLEKLHVFALNVKN